MDDTPVSMHQTYREFSRREVFRLGSRGAAFLALAGCVTSGPNYLYLRGGHASDFQAHLDSEKFGRFDIGGVDLTFGDGTPLWSPCKGMVQITREYPSSGKVTSIDYEIVQISLMHQKEMNVYTYQEVARNMVIGTQGKTGSITRNISHLHLTVYGNAVLCADKERRLPWGHNYLKASSVEGGIGAKGLQFLYPYHWNFVLNPDKLTPDGKPLYKSFWNPLDRNQDYDTDYLRVCNEEIRPAFEAIAYDWKNKRFGKQLEPRLTRSPLYEIINFSWVFREKTKNQRRGRRLRRRLDEAFALVEKAGGMIKLTSPYLDHKNPAAIRYMIERNPRHKDLILKYYGKFLRAA